MKILKAILSAMCKLIPPTILLVACWRVPELRYSEDTILYFTIWICMIILLIDSAIDVFSNGGHK